MVLLCAMRLKWSRGEHLSDVAAVSPALTRVMSPLVRFRRRSADKGARVVRITIHECRDTFGSTLHLAGRIVKQHTRYIVKCFPGRFGVLAFADLLHQF